ncbi:hypothetical protein AAFF_G00295050 [Aldrovandia affinis]|uniref:Uncharacterized protein n=1 Tax=Aldrovandia affinis TaxID=143900 RepID=A0AAD7R9M0_9TELE|nr:hypothetical protein AAFF_G00295050 [Aldrovandia affinis]
MTGRLEASALERRSRLTSPVSLNTPLPDCHSPMKGPRTLAATPVQHNSPLRPRRPDCMTTEAMGTDQQPEAYGPRGFTCSSPASCQSFLKRVWTAVGFALCKWASEQPVICSLSISDFLLMELMGPVTAAQAASALTEGSGTQDTINMWAWSSLQECSMQSHPELPLIGPPRGNSLLPAAGASAQLRGCSWTPTAVLNIPGPRAPGFEISQEAQSYFLLSGVPAAVSSSLLHSKAREAMPPPLPGYSMIEIARSGAPPGNQRALDTEQLHVDNEQILPRQQSPTERLSGSTQEEHNGSLVENKLPLTMTT